MSTEARIFFAHAIASLLQRARQAHANATVCRRVGNHIAADLYLQDRAEYIGCARRMIDRRRTHQKVGCFEVVKP